jgi:thymidine phosphorylase
VEGRRSRADDLSGHGYPAQGMNLREIPARTAAVMARGVRMELSSLLRPTSDKHSTGGSARRLWRQAALQFLSLGAGLGRAGGNLDFWLRRQHRACEPGSRWW